MAHCTAIRPPARACPNPVTYSEKDGDYCDDHGRAKHRLRDGPTHSCRHCVARDNVNERNLAIARAAAEEKAKKAKKEGS